MLEHVLVNLGFVQLNTVAECFIVTDGYCSYRPVFSQVKERVLVDVLDGFRLFYNLSNHRYAVLQSDMLVKPIKECPIYLSNKWRQELIAKEVWRSAK